MTEPAAPSRPPAETPSALRLGGNPGSGRISAPRLVFLVLMLVTAPLWADVLQVSRYPTFQIFLVGVLAMTLTLIAAPIWIGFLEGKGIGQLIREDGPQEHLQKAGTPTMGGLLILLMVFFSYLVIVQPWTKTELYLGSLLALAGTLAFGALGFADDFSKIRRTRSLGLRARTKLLSQGIISVIIAWVAINLYRLPTSLDIPLTGLHFDLGIAYYLLAFLIMAGTTNAVNLTDGLDGLAAGTVMIVMMAFAAIAFREGKLDLAIFCAAVGGACIGLLWYNAYPANIFMGDTGSLALGGAVALLAILTKSELLLLVIGGIFVIESLSVIVQVLGYRFFGVRVLKMAPIHHHFELLGWSETIIMVRFWIITGVLAGAGFSLYFFSTLRGG